MGQTASDIGMVGLGVMGRNLALNWAEHGYRVAGFDLDTSKVEVFEREGTGLPVQGAGQLAEFVAMLKRPRAIMMLVPAGSPVDAVIRDLLPYLTPDDLLLDGGNSHFTDTTFRGEMLAENGILYMGVGISGGEYGARHGPSIMPGGPREAYTRVQPLLEASAAKVDGDPCVAYLGPGAAGHYVKMVHNGIEYGLMRLIAETYDLMKRGLGLDHEEIAQVYQQWDDEEFHAYLLEITAQILRKIDEQTGRPLVDMILDEAEQKGTGSWTSEDALSLQMPTPTIDVAVAMRGLSLLKSEREEASHLLAGPEPVFQGNRAALLDQLRGALSASMLLVFAQGMALLHRASEAYEYHFDLAEVARIWRGGCIIRAAILEELLAAYREQPKLPNLLLHPRLASRIVDCQADLRNVVATGAQLGLSIPAMMVSLGYYDSYRSARMPANLIQAQRDFFGAHTYERVDRKGVFHTHWTSAEEHVSAAVAGTRS
jgi:6-phosphogluconate dehydrogenase